MPYVPDLSFREWLEAVEATPEHPPAEWQRNEQGDWSNLNPLPPINANLMGVYIIFNNDEVLYVGQGNIRTNLNRHRTEDKFKDYNLLLATWTEIGNEEDRRGVERFLQCNLAPELNKPIIMKINLPDWEE